MWRNDIHAESEMKLSEINVDNEMKKHEMK